MGCIQGWDGDLEFEPLRALGRKCRFRAFMFRCACCVLVCIQGRFGAFFCFFFFWRGEGRDQGRKPDD
jgi:hypothetical protein